MAAPSLVFSVNGERKEILSSELDPRKNLAEYLRNDLRLTGTKVSCEEGGCGACTVTVEGVNGGVRSVNSCLFPVANADGLAITTVEGLGGKGGKNLHPVQERIAKMNALQCGFCTPGMVSNTYAALKEHGNKLSPEAVESMFDGNLCRCTGYRPILDAAKSLCANGDIEDLAKCKGCKAYNPAEDDPKFPDFLKDYQPASVSFSAASKDGESTWIRPTSVEEACVALAGAKVAARPVVANTGAGIYKNTALSHGKTEVLVSLLGIKSLNEINVQEDGLRIGGAVTLRLFSNALRDNDKNGVFGRMAHHINRIGNRHIRAAGSLAGNIVLCKKHAFWSDAAIVLMAANATIHLVSAAGRSTQPMEEFLSTNAFASPDQIIEGIFVPFPADNAVWRSYKISGRPQNAHALGNGAFLVQVEKDTIVGARLVFGCQSNDAKSPSHAVLATKTAAAITGKPVNSDTLAAALVALKDEVQIGGTGYAEYRTDLHAGFLFKVFRALSGDKIAQEEEDAFANRGETKSSQTYKVADKDHPVHQPIPKLIGPNLSSGDAKFGDDMPVAEGTLFGAFVASTEARASIKSVDVSAALNLPGVVRYVCAKDVKGANTASPAEPHPIFAEEKSFYWGQPIGMILATSTRKARDAARLVKVEYEKTDGKPILNIEQAIERGTITPVSADNKNPEGPDAESELEKAPKKASGLVNLGTQLHFYMENQNVTVTPDEDDTYLIQSPTQWPGRTVGTIAGALGVGLDRVRLVHRRSGGGFGGRITHPVMFGAAAAVASQAAGVPVRLVMERDIDSLMCGGREEARLAYDVGFDDSGKILALKVEGHLESGFNMDFSGFANGVTAGNLNSCYNIPAYHFKTTVVLSDKGTRTAVRGPGELPANHTMDSIIQRVAFETGKTATEVRKANLYPAEGEFKLPGGAPLAHYTVPEMWKKSEDKSGYDARRAAVDEYNKTHRWTKRGLDIIPMRYGVMVFPKSALVNINADGTVIVHHGCEDIGQGANVKIAQAVVNGLSPIGTVSMDKIRFASSDSWVLPNQTFTGGSTGTEGAVAAVRKACATLVAQMKPVLEGLVEAKKKKAEESGEKEEDVAFGDVLTAVTNPFGMPFVLSATGHFSNVAEEAFAYQNYGVGVSEVELDVLTGQLRVLYSSILYDCGESLNPAIDIGQAEGAYVMGLGAYLREGCRYDPENGQMLTPSTWEYKPSFAGDIPEQFDVEFLVNPKFDKGVLSSKSSGEPPLVLAGCVVSALRNAIRSVRADNGRDDWFEVPVPATPQVIRGLCAVGAADFKL